MRVVRFSTFDQLAPLAADWDRLSRAVPFRSWAWMSNWWRHYGCDDADTRRIRRLFTLAVFDPSGRPVGIAPWYCEHTSSGGRVLRFLGSGEVCADYLSVLCEPPLENRVSRALSDWLTEAGSRPAERPARPDADTWDLLELTGIDAEDAMIGRLAADLQQRGNTVHRRPGPNCWRIELPTSWEKYLAMLSKSHRKHIRRWERKLLATRRCVLHGVRRPADLSDAERILIDLHQRRHESLGKPGCFASRRFGAFHHDVMSGLLRNGQLHLTWVELDGKPIAAEYQLAGGGVVYAYQAGVDPRALEHSPGHLNCLLTLRRAIERGYLAFDFLRGDEPYKAHWRARPRSTLEVRVAAPRTSARLRHQLWLAGSRVRCWVKDGLKLAEYAGLATPATITHRCPAPPPAHNKPCPH